MVKIRQRVLVYKCDVFHIQLSLLHTLCWNVIITDDACLMLQKLTLLPYSVLQRTINPLNPPEDPRSAFNI